MKKISYFAVFLLLISINCLNSFSDQVINNEDKSKNSENVVEINYITNDKNDNLNNKNSVLKKNTIDDKKITTENNNISGIGNVNNKEKENEKNKENNLNLRKTLTSNNNSKKDLKQENNQKKLKQNSNQDSKRKTNKINNQKYHIVSKGENISKISLKYGIKQQELTKLNSNIKNNRIYIGQKLILPDNIGIQKTNISSDVKVSDNISITDKDQKTDKKEHIKEKKVSLSNNLLEIKDSKKTDKDQKTNKKNITNKLNSITFIWPTYGTLSSRFGYQTRIEKLKGVDIICELNSTVRASSSGVIVYSDKVNGYDNVIIIKHHNGFFTVYGHVEPIVKVNDIIKKGQVIAYVSKSKQSKESKLFFLIRKDKESYNPEKLIQTKISG